MSTLISSTVPHRKLVVSNDRLGHTAPASQLDAVLLVFQDLGGQGGEYEPVTSLDSVVTFLPA